VNARAGNPFQPDGVWLVARVKIHMGQLVSEHLQEAKLKAASARREGHARTAGGFDPEAEANFHGWSSAKVGEESAGQSFDENGRRGNRPTASGAAAMETFQRLQAGATLRRAREPQSAVERFLAQAKDAGPLKITSRSNKIGRRRRFSDEQLGQAVNALQTGSGTSHAHEIFRRCMTRRNRPPPASVRSPKRSHSCEGSEKPQGRRIDSRVDPARGLVHKSIRNVEAGSSGLPAAPDSAARPANARGQNLREGA